MMEPRFQPPRHLLQHSREVNWWNGLKPLVGCTFYSIQTKSLHVHINTERQRQREQQDLQDLVLLPEGASDGCAVGHETLSPLVASTAVKSGTLIYTSRKSCSCRRAREGIRLQFNRVQFKMKSAEI